MTMPLPQGFALAVASAGFKTPGRNDLAAAVSDRPAAAAAVFTRALFKAAPVRLGSAIVAERGQARAVLINTGQANACTGADGLAACRATQAMLAEAFALQPCEVLPASTGVIGAQLKLDAFRAAMPELKANLGAASLEDFARAIMTTDAFPKFRAERLDIGGKEVILAGAAKGAGMICPNMATMLCTLLCDAEVERNAWQALLARAVDKTFNRATVDGDTSTNDTVYALANGASGARAEGERLAPLEEAVTRLLADLAYRLVQDGEGATKVLHIRVTGAASEADAEMAARAVGHSPLVKTAMYGKDANWGRIVAALGRSGASFDPALVRVSLCGVELFRREQPTDLDFDALLREPLEQRDIHIDIGLGSGTGAYELLASDLTHEYININADYRS